VAADLVAGEGVAVEEEGPEAAAGHDGGGGGPARPGAHDDGVVHGGQWSVVSGQWSPSGAAKLRTEAGRRRTTDHGPRVNKKSEGKRSASRRFDLLPLLPSGPDGVQRELAVRDLPSLRRRTVDHARGRGADRQRAIYGRARRPLRSGRGDGANAPPIHRHGRPATARRLPAR